ncbi:MAG: SLC13 family permease [Woeseiaceae bacterium]|nr:SLC13 family permease [Woeseiaceae bacterium]
MSKDEFSAPEGGVPRTPSGVALAGGRPRLDVGRLVALLAGIAGFLVFALMPELPVAVDPLGEPFELNKQARLALGLFVLAAIWWVFEVVPVGITAITIAVVQAVFNIRDARTALTDFFDPAVWFILGALVIGTAFARSGLTNRIAYRMLALVGERTAMIYFGSFVMTAFLTLFMAHSAVAAAVYPLLAVIYSAYADGDEPTRFGKGLFIGMAFTAGAGSIITLFGAARGAVAIGLYRDLVGREISFFELSYYMLPVGVVMVVLLWLYMLVVFPPEKSSIPGLKERARELHSTLGPLRWQEWLTLLITLTAVVAMSLRSVVPLLGAIDKSAIILATTVLFFVFGCLKLPDLESLPINIILLFGGAMSIGFCLWQTGAAQWLAINWLNALPTDSPLLFVIGVAVFVLIMTNLIMNVAAIAISLPVALAIAPYLGVAPEVIVFAALATAGMPFLSLVGAAPNAIAYQSRQFTAAQFFRAGVPASVLLILVIALFVWKVWPWMGMPVTVEPHL